MRFNLAQYPNEKLVEQFNITEDRQFFDVRFDFFGYQNALFLPNGVQIVPALAFFFGISLLAVVLSLVMDRCDVR